MRKLIVTEFVSLDGVMEAPGGEPGYAHSGWVGPFFSDELGAYKQDELLATDLLLMGRRTYEGFYGAWPYREGPFADKINTMPKYVASTTLRTVEWQNARLLDTPVADSVAGLKQQDGGPIMVGGSRTLVHTLLKAGLVDQLNLQVFPLLLGSGMRLYPETSGTTALRLLSSEALPSGVMLQAYQPVAA
ncbi:MAG: dihydrofolate reductase family protein [Actinomycetes bacterium]